jgi:hypothetical protein
VLQDRIKTYIPRRAESNSIRRRGGSRYDLVAAWNDFLTLLSLTDLRGVLVGGSRRSHCTRACFVCGFCFHFSCFNIKKDGCKTRKTWSDRSQILKSDDHVPPCGRVYVQNVTNGPVPVVRLAFLLQFIRCRNDGGYTTLAFAP